MFEPPCCPYPSCPRNSDPRRKFFVRWGRYAPNCRARPVPRFRCKSCGRTFSRQTFRMDYCDHRPSLNAQLFRLLASGVGLRQSSRLLGLSFRCTELKFRKIARHLRRLNLNLRAQLTGTASFHFDELETYEGQRNTRPLTVPFLIESTTRFIVWSEAASIRPRGKMTEKRKEAVVRAESRHGKRRDDSRHAIRRTLKRGAQLASSADVVVLSTDEKSSYPGLANDAFGHRRLDHRRTNSKLVRRTWNPLFPINHEEAMARDLSGRLRRESWLVSKKRRYLNLGLQLHAAYRNLVRSRFNYDAVLTRIDDTLRVYSIDRVSGGLTEVAGSPFAPGALHRQSRSPQPSALAASALLTRFLQTPNRLPSKNRAARRTASRRIANSPCCPTACWLTSA